MEHAQVIPDEDIPAFVPHADGVGLVEFLELILNVLDPLVATVKEVVA